MKRMFMSNGIAARIKDADVIASVVGMRRQTLADKFPRAETICSSMGEAASMVIRNQVPCTAEE